MQALRHTSLKRWEIKKNGKFILDQFNQVKREEFEPIDKFNTRFDTLINDFPDDLRPKAKAIFLHYVRAFEGQ